ncbi:hypothetical protein Tco_1275796 [Tanacetum coccineum]
MKTSRRAARAKKDEPNEPPKDWTMANWFIKRSRSLVNGKIGFALELVLFAPSSIMLKRITKVGRKNSKTSATTLGSASGGLNLNEEADEAVEETQEF